MNYIDNDPDLQKSINKLAKADEIAIDLEFDKNRYRYGFNICLMQVATSEECFLIDPLSPQLTIQKIFPLLEDPKQQLITFSFGEDMRLLHSMNCFPKNIFDTATAARLLNQPQASLGNVLKEILDIELDHKAQKSNWFIRPLSEKQMLYAKDDVLFLHELKESIWEKAQEKDVAHWVEQENSIWDEVDFSNIDNNNYLREKDKKQFTKFEWHVYKQLMELREEKAASLNRPSYQVIPKEYMVEMAKRPTQIHRFHKIRGIHRKLANNDFKEELHHTMKQAVEEAESRNLSQSKKAHSRMSPEEYKTYKANRKIKDKAKKKIFKPIQKLIGERYGEHTVNFLLNNRLIGELAVGNTENLLPYRRKLLDELAAELDIDLREYYE